MKMQWVTRALCAALMTGAAMVPVAVAADWVEVGADAQAKYYIDADSIKVDGENVSVLKRGVFTQILTDTLGGKSATFKETIGTVEIDCARRINRVTQIDMIGENGELAWSSGPMTKRLWEDVRPNTHAEATVELVCARLKKS
jgi:uncharacterized phage protein gp47/JayE